MTALNVAMAATTAFAAAYAVDALIFLIRQHRAARRNP